MHIRVVQILRFAGKLRSSHQQRSFSCTSSYQYRFCDLQRVSQRRMEPNTSRTSSTRQLQLGMCPLVNQPDKQNDQTVAGMGATPRPPCLLLTGAISHQLVRLLATWSGTSDPAHPRRCRQGSVARAPPGARKFWCRHTPMTGPRPPCPRRP